MKDKVLTFIAGLLVGAILASGGFLIFLNVSKKNNPAKDFDFTQMKDFPQGEKREGFDGEMPDDVKEKFKDGELPDDFKEKFKDDKMPDGKQNQKSQQENQGAEEKAETQV